MYVNDLIDNNNNFLKYEDFKKIFNVNSNYLEYASLIKATEHFIKHIPFDLSKLKKIVGPLIPQDCVYFLRDSISSDVYSILCMNHVLPSSQKKYREKGLHIEKQNWRRYYLLPFKCTLDTSLQWLQFRILHRILATNSFLNKIGIVESNLCTFCKSDTETLQHLFYDCYCTKHFLSTLCEWLLVKGNIHLSLSKLDFLFGIALNKTNKVLNWILLQAKKFIYNSRARGKKPDFNIFIKNLEQEFNIKRYILLKNSRLAEFQNIWRHWMTFFGDQQP